jgi:hypothetical protein
MLKARLLRFGVRLIRDGDLQAERVVTQFGQRATVDEPSLMRHEMHHHKRLLWAFLQHIAEKMSACLGCFNQPRTLDASFCKTPKVLPLIIAAIKKPGMIARRMTLLRRLSVTMSFASLKRVCCDPPIFTSS